MKTFKRIILIAVCCFFALSLVACNFGGGGTTKPGDKVDDKKNTKEQTPTDIKKISNLTDYGARALIPIPYNFPTVNMRTKTLRLGFPHCKNV